jgi:hypothetical protein
MADVVSKPDAEDKPKSATPSPQLHAETEKPPASCENKDKKQQANTCEPHAVAPKPSTNATATETKETSPTKPIPKDHAESSEPDESSEPAADLSRWAWDKMEIGKNLVTSNTPEVSFSSLTSLPNLRLLDTEKDTDYRFKLEPTEKIEFTQTAFTNNLEVSPSPKESGNKPNSMKNNNDSSNIGSQLDWSAFDLTKGNWSYFDTAGKGGTLGPLDSQVTFGDEWWLSDGNWKDVKFSLSDSSFDFDFAAPLEPKDKAMNSSSEPSTDQSFWSNLGSQLRTTGGAITANAKSAWDAGMNWFSDTWTKSSDCTDKLLDFTLSKKDNLKSVEFNAFFSEDELKNINLITSDAYFSQDAKSLTHKTTLGEIAVDKDSKTIAMKATNGDSYFRSSEGTEIITQKDGSEIIRSKDGRIIVKEPARDGLPETTTEIIDNAENKALIKRWGDKFTVYNHGAVRLNSWAQAREDLDKAPRALQTYQDAQTMRDGKVDVRIQNDNTTAFKLADGKILTFDTKNKVWTIQDNEKATGRQATNDELNKYIQRKGDRYRVLGTLLTVDDQGRVVRQQAPGSTEAPVTVEHKENGDITASADLGNGEVVETTTKPSGQTVMKDSNEITVYDNCTGQVKTTDATTGETKFDYDFNKHVFKSDSVTFTPQGTTFNSMNTFIDREGSVYDSGGSLVYGSSSSSSGKYSTSYTNAEQTSQMAITAANAVVGPIQAQVAAGNINPAAAEARIGSALGKLGQALAVALGAGNFEAASSIIFKQAHLESVLSQVQAQRKAEEAAKHLIPGGGGSYALAHVKALAGGGAMPTGSAVNFLRENLALDTGNNRNISSADVNPYKNNPSINALMIGIY